jgi:hypothetical protein
MPWYSIKKILESGVSTANRCGKFEAEAKPGELIFFVRPLTWWERLSQQVGGSRFALTSLRLAWYDLGSMQGESELAQLLRCSFCHKTQKQVDKLISSPPQFPGAYICGECVRACQLILDDLEPRRRKTATRALIDLVARRVFRIRARG